jgi:hypothetical protein
VSRVNHFERMIREAVSPGSPYFQAMNLYRIQGIPESLAADTRATMRSPQYGHPAHVEVATGYGPCRLCLQTFTEGSDERVLFTYQPFTDSDALPAPGPIFIHREPCERYDDLSLPEALRPVPLVLEGYGSGGALLVQRRVGNGSFEAALDEVMARPGAQYAHLRNAEAGCFIARIDRFTAQD